MINLSLSSAKTRCSILFLLLMGSSFCLNAQTISTIAGGSVGDGKPGTSVGITETEDIETDAAENVYIIDRLNGRVRKIEAGTGLITTVAGNGNAGYAGDGGLATAASFTNLRSLAIDAVGNIYICDLYRIRKIDAVTGIITTIAGNGTNGFAGDGGQATSAQISASSIALDQAGNLYLNDLNRIRKINLSTGIISTVAGTGVAGNTGDGGLATSAQLNTPRTIAVTATGDIFLIDAVKSIIRKITASTGIITTYAGNGTIGTSGDGGPAVDAQFISPTDIDVNTAGDLFITDAHKVRKVEAATGNIATAAGTGSPGFGGDNTDASNAVFALPRAISISNHDHIYIDDYSNSVVRRIDGATNIITTIGGNRLVGYSGIGGNITDAQILRPSGFVIDNAGNTYFSDVNNNVIYRIEAGTGTLSIVVGTGIQGNDDGNGSPAIAANITAPGGMLLDHDQNLYFIEKLNTVRRVDYTTGFISRFAGNGASSGYSGDGGPAVNAALNGATALAIDPDGNIYIADRGNHRIRRVLKSDGSISTVVGTGISGYSGDGASATAAQLNAPIAIVFDQAGNLYISDNGNAAIRKVDVTTGIITTIAGGNGIGSNGDGGLATAARLNFPHGLAIDAGGNLYVADQSNNRIRKINLSTGIITTVAGTGLAGYNEDGIPAADAAISTPRNIIFDAAGDLYFSDLLNNRIRKITAGATLTAFAFYDSNGDNVKEPTEKWADDIKITILETGGYTRTGYTKNGQVVLEVAPGDYNITATPPLFYTASNDKNITLSSTNRTDSVTFAISPFPGEKDMQVSLLALTPARPGKSMRYRILYKNTGTVQMTNIPLTFIKNSKVTITSSKPAYQSIKSDTLSWTIPLLQPNDTGSVDIEATLATAPVAVSGDILHAYTYVKIANNMTMDDDTARIRQVVTENYNPNSKTELHNGVLTPEQLDFGEYLTYLIHFQNTGTDTAFTVVVRDTLDANLDLYSLQMVGASHDYSLAIDGDNRLIWTFTNIKLPDSTTNEKASHGFLSFRIRANWYMDPNDILRNTCAISFDFKEPVLTNTVSTDIKGLPVAPVKPAINVGTLTWCGADGDKQVKVINLPAVASAITVRARLNTTTLTIGADSTFTLKPQQLTPGNYTLRIEYVNEAGEQISNYPVVITAAVAPDVDLSADKTQIAAPAEKVNITATNKKDGGTAPLYTFAKDKAFANILQAESSSNKLVLAGDDYTNGDIWVYVRMKTSEACFATATSIDSIKVTKNVLTTGIVDADNPATIIMGYPNPFSNQVIVGGLSLAKTYRLYVYDNLGRLVHQQMIYNKSSLVIPATAWKTGAYWVTLFDHRKNKLLGSIPVTKQ